MSTNIIKKPTLVQALIPIILVMTGLALSVYFYGDSSSYGPNQVVLLLVAGVGVVIALRLGHQWSAIKQAIIEGINVATGAILILLMVGALIATWMASGTVPTLIFYGLQILDPSYFYVATCVICALVAISIGSSWTVAGTVGLSLVLIADAMGLNLAITAGAVISGAYFGDKMSPLSDTTNLAPAVAGTDLFTHIHHMIWTTAPSIILALLIFTMLGLSAEVKPVQAGLTETTDFLQSKYNIGWHLLLPLLLVIILAVKKVPAFIAILLGAVAAGIMAVYFQPQLFTDDQGNILPAHQSFLTVFEYFKNGFAILNNNGEKNELLSRGGISSMINTVLLIVCAMTFGAVLEKAGILQRLVEAILHLVKSTGSLITAVVATCISTNMISADQYIAIILPGRLFKLEFDKRGLHAKNLSRTIEDAGTLTSPLIFWNTCGLYMASTLGVPTLTYMWFCFFNLINPMVAIIYGFCDIKITRMSEQEHAETLAKIEVVEN